MFLGKLKKEMAKYAHLMVEQGYSVAQEGNISRRIGDNRILITPSNLIKHLIMDADMVEIDFQGNLVKGKRQPTTERFTHIEIYRQKPEVKAIVHAHPFYTVLSTVLGEKPFEKVFLSEAAMFLRNVKFSPYAKPSTKEGAEVIKNICRETNILIIDLHGSFTYGENLQTAFSYLELLEKYCKMYYYANLSGKKICCLSDEEIRELEKVKY